MTEPSERLAASQAALRWASIRAIARKRGWQVSDAEVTAVASTQKPIAEAIATLERVHC